MNHYMYNWYPNKNHMAKGALAHSIAVSGVSVVCRVARPTNPKTKARGLKGKGWSSTHNLYTISSHLRLPQSGRCELVLSKMTSRPGQNVTGDGWVWIQQQLYKRASADFVWACFIR